MITETGLKRLRERLKIIANQREGMKPEIAHAIKHKMTRILEIKKNTLNEYESEYETLETLLDKAVVEVI